MSSEPFKCEPKAEKYLLDIVEEAIGSSIWLREFSDKLLRTTATRLFDWIDCISVTSPVRARELGFVELKSALFHHPRAQLPLIQVAKKPFISFHVDSIEHFLLQNGLACQIDGSHFAPLRRATIWQNADLEVMVSERRALDAVAPTTLTPQEIVNILEAMTIWMTRPRGGVDDTNDFKVAQDRALLLSKRVGIEQAAEIILQTERLYWQGKNRAGQWQKSRQDSLGLGWGNHDHHTFRSSRKYFKSLVQLFESVGFYCRERFYAGQEAGWGAQVMEHKNHRFVLFLDVDLLPNEIDIDFSHEELPELPHLGTIGLWCGLHGESILSAGMHHLEAQFSFDLLHKDLETAGIGMMKPFSSYPYLQQAFSKGERWSVPKNRLNHLLERGLITKEQFEKFNLEGAIGSHLENLERNQGYKGFNQKNVSYIISETDPRRS